MAPKNCCTASIPSASNFPTLPHCRRWLIRKAYPMFNRILRRFAKGYVHEGPHVGSTNDGHWVIHHAKWHILECRLLDGRRNGHRIERPTAAARGSTSLNPDRVHAVGVGLSSGILAGRRRFDPADSGCAAGSVLSLPYWRAAPKSAPCDRPASGTAKTFSLRPIGTISARPTPLAG